MNIVIKAVTLSDCFYFIKYKNEKLSVRAYFNTRVDK